MFRYISLLFLNVTLFAQTHKPVGLVVTYDDGKIESVGLGTNLVVMPATATTAARLQVILPLPLPPIATLTYRFFESQLKRLSDGTWTPVTNLIGNIIPASIMLTKNGVYQEGNFDYKFDSSNNSIKLLYILDVTDRLYFRCVTSQ